MTVNFSRASTARLANVSVKPLDGSVLVAWERPAGEPTVTHFELTPCYGSVWLAERAVIVDGSSSSGMIRGLLNGTTYVVRITPYNDEVPEPAAVTSSFEPNPAPEAPVNVVAVAGEQSATVTWVPPPGGGPIAQYLISASPPHVEPRRVPAGQTSVLMDGLHNRSRYSFTVAAANEAGEGVSAPSNSIWPGDDVPRYLFPLELLCLALLGAVAYLYAVHQPFTISALALTKLTVPPLRDLVPPAVAGVPISIPWFGALGAVLTGLYGIFDHGHRDWQRRFNAWYVARPLTGAALGTVAYIVFVGTIRATGLQPAAQDPVGKLIYFAVAFVVGFREETFRQLIARVGDMILGPGGNRYPAVSPPGRLGPAPQKPQPPATSRAAEPQ